MQHFYVYEHWRPDTCQCFYVGKGAGIRKGLMCRRNRHHLAIQNKLKDLGLEVEIKVISSGLSEDDAFALEMRLIAFWRASGSSYRLDRKDAWAGGEGEALQGPSRKDNVRRCAGQNLSHAES